MSDRRKMWVGFVAGLLATAALPFAVGTTVDLINGPGSEGGARRTKTIADVIAIEEALSMFANDHGRWPSAEEGLNALIPDYLDRLPNDPWGNEYAYNPGTHAVVSYAADEKPGGEGVARDVTHDEISTRAERLRGPAVPDEVLETLLMLSLLVVPLIAYLATDRPSWSIGVFGGAAAFFAVMTLFVAAVSLAATSYQSSVVALGIGLAFTAAAIAVFKRARYAAGAALTLMIALIGSLWMFLPRVVR